MILSHLSLQNFRSYTKASFDFTQTTTVIIGPNTAGKSNLVEALFLLSSGKSFRAEKDLQMIRFDKEIARVKGKIVSSLEPSPVRRGDSPKATGEVGKQDHIDETALEVVISQLNNTYSKRFLVNNVPKRRVDFMEQFHALLFAPTHLDIVSGSPSVRRGFLDEVLESVDREYRQAAIQYEKALRQRNALLHQVRETGRRDQKRFEYWDALLIEHGQTLTGKREAFLEFINAATKDLLSFHTVYDRSTVSEARLDQYKAAEEVSGVTLVGPHRDDFWIQMDPNDNSPNASESLDVKFFGSRGQQRLVVLQLKLLQLQFMEEHLGHRPVLLLDDIFSELDDHHIEIVMGIANKQQTIITTTHEEFISNKIREAMVIKL